MQANRTRFRLELGLCGLGLILGALAVKLRLPDTLGTVFRVVAVTTVVVGFVLGKWARQEREFLTRPDAVAWGVSALGAAFALTITIAPLSVHGPSKLHRCSFRGNPGTNGDEGVFIGSDWKRIGLRIHPVVLNPVNGPLRMLKLTSWLARDA